ncbi:MAG TPA: protein translocase subunit SecF [Candidatus Azoamicus sp. OHIO2]
MYINFVKYFKINLIVSILLVCVCIFYIITNSIDLGLEFTGGLNLELEYEKKVSLNIIRHVFKEFKDVKIKYYGSKKNIQIKVKKTHKDRNDFIVLIKNLIDSGAKVVKIEYIGAEVTKNIINNSIKAVFLSILLMFIYLMVRFDYINAISAITILIHDIIVVLGVISFFDLELDFSVMAALFAVFGYVVNDTIIIFDRIREIKKLYHLYNMTDIINIALNNTLSRTLMTSLSTLVVVIIILIFGNEYLFGFALTLFCGIIIGTYSSIYIATVPLLFFDTNKK